MTVLSLLEGEAGTVGLLLRAKAAVVMAEDTMCQSDTVSNSELLCTERSRNLTPSQRNEPALNALI